MLRIAIVFVFAAFAATPALAQAPATGMIMLESQSATRALDAVPAVFAVARNMENVQVDLGMESMAGGFSDLAGEAAAQEQLTAALGAYGFETFSDWAATARTLFAAYAYIQSVGSSSPEVASAMQSVMDDASIPQGQKDALAKQIDGDKAGVVAAGAVTPSEENLVVVIALLPQIASTIQMMQAMQ